MKLIIPTDIADVEVEEQTEVISDAADVPVPTPTVITVDGKPVKSINFKKKGQ